MATKLLDYGAIPITFSDQSGHIYEQDGFQQSKLRTVQKVKKDRGAKVSLGVKDGFSSLLPSYPRFPGDSLSLAAAFPP